MHDRYLEITFRKGKALAAYIYLSRKPGVKIEHTKKLKSGIVIDFDQNNTPIGIEITTPSHVNVSEINDVLNSLNQSPISEEEFSPLKAA